MLGAEIENLQPFDWRFPVGRFRSKRRRRPARPITPCLTYNPTKPGWLLATKSTSFCAPLAAQSWYVLVPLTVETTVGGHPVTVHQPWGSVKDETPLLKAQGGLTAGRSVAK